ncbi:MAG: hypothetical protein KJZ78_00340 [Bryobacteraceae bacterium]|nr:hypothetical protein [Bryobacteraceae bacterium]
MKRRDVERIIETKLEELASGIINRLKELPGDVWVGYAADLQRGQSLFFEEYERLLESECSRAVGGLSSADLELLWFATDSYWDHDDDKPSGRGIWEDGVAADLFRRVTSAADAEDLDEDDDEDDEEEERYEFDEEDLLFFSDVAKVLDRPETFRGLSPKDSGSVRSLIDALRRLPEWTPEIDIRLEVSHRVGDDAGFSESCACVVALSSEQIEISAGGSQYDPAVGSDSISHESFEWYPGSVSEKNGSTDTWLERLIYALDSEHSTDVTDANADEETASN